MVRDPGDILARTSGGEHDCGETPAQRGGVEEDRRFDADELRIGSSTSSHNQSPRRNGVAVSTKRAALGPNTGPWPAFGTTQSAERGID